ncbi:MAG: hypothetical protein ABEH43_11455 [Flavobacteriales bacterium]
MKEELQQQELLRDEENINGHDRIERLVYPDIIIHTRGTGDNLCIIEVKKSSSSVNDEYDRFKLEKYTEIRDEETRLWYQLGIFLKIEVDDNPGYTVECFQRGKYNESLTRQFEEIGD